MSGRRAEASRGLVVASVCLLGLAACSEAGGGGGDAAGPTGSPSPVWPSSTVSVPPQVTLTDPGAELAFGDSASVVYEVDRRGTVLDLTVKKATRGSLKDFSAYVLNAYTKKSTPYYVNVTVENVGQGGLGAADIPLWGVDANDTLLPAASFTTDFAKCESKPLPRRFQPRASVDTCLVYLAPNKGTLTAVSFRPTQQFDPIVWKGAVVTPKPKPTRTPQPKKG
jgi:hypothetical protein